jgi:molecular chaperone DnaK
VDKTATPVYNALSDAGISASELSRVLLVGGSTRIPAVQDKVKALTGITPSKNINPDECVATGAAIQGNTLSGGELQIAGSQEGILLLDVTPLSLSIETVGGVATRLVDRNSTLPVHYSQVFSTAAPYQTSVDIHVLQGERPMASDNKTIGKFKLKGIKKAPAGVPQIEVTFDIDTNGILTVSAKDLDTGKEQSITITANEKMSDFEIEQAIKDAELYASQDQTRREALAVTSEAEKLLAATEQALSKCGKQLEKAEKKQVKSDISALRKLLFKSKPTNLSEGDILNIRSAMNVLESSGNHVRTLAGND